ncbi:hypothetical protein XBKB1_200001 [Xenorhabdus bovienii str. kraussei Becker Underwood]|uniref:Uncharacterized protein n=1 Tax=Xenorhabdus bovienii str. kraussei Becker Underwood TaxID=1398204 RepID=A0A077PHD7_XENBV|nr:hypothetical protein XBKB1_200001 [Xenorhabdus bovienii str. kraussei Becker Underwood]
MLSLYIQLLLHFHQNNIIYQFLINHFLPFLKKNLKFMFVKAIF